ncbi:MAG: cob(I)yrinic acid a,c-diamide adenosyltransferase [Pseudomonadota bacterium]
MVELTKIYTKGGDKGKTSLVDGTRRAKHNARVDAYGTVDETNSVVGIARLHTDGDIDAMLSRIQNDLFDVGADLATPGENFEGGEMELRVQASQVERLESEIDTMNEELEPLKSFVLPGGDPAAAHLHLARTVARRAERGITMAMEQEPINPAAMRYMNRLSDHFFVLSRYVNARSTGDVLWVPGANR